MTAPLSPSDRFNQYVEDSQALSSFTTKHIKAAVVMGAVSLALGALTFIALHYGLPQGSYSQTATIAFSAAAGATFLPLALVIIALHYAIKIADKKSQVDAEKFFEVLKATSQDTVIKFTKDLCAGWIKEHFSDAQYEEVLSYIAETQFLECGPRNIGENDSLDPDAVDAVYTTLFQADNKRFLQISYKMMKQGDLGLSHLTLKNFCEKKVWGLGDLSLIGIFDAIDTKEAILFQPFFENSEFQDVITLQSDKTLRLMTLIDHAYFRSEPSEPTTGAIPAIESIKTNIIDKIEWSQNFLKGYYKSRSSFSKQFRNYMDAKMDAYLNRITSLEWGEIISKCDRTVCKGSEQEFTPYALVEKMCRLSRNKFDNAIGDGGCHLTRDDPVFHMSKSLKNWLHTVRDDEYATELGRVYSSPQKPTNHPKSKSLQTNKKQL